jgi:hypothetical protein
MNFYRKLDYTFAQAILAEAIASQFELAQLTPGPAILDLAASWRATFGFGYLCTTCAAGISAQFAAIETWFGNQDPSR